MPFRSTLRVDEVDDGKNHWETVLPLVYSGKWEDFTVPPGFRTDFASVPRAFWATHPPYGRHTKAAVLHDWLYREKPVTRRTGLPITRKDADGIFERTMRELGTAWWRRKTMWAAVRLFGWIGFRR